MLDYLFELFSNLDGTINQISDSIIWKMSQFVDDVLLRALFVVNLINAEQAEDDQEGHKGPP